MGELDLAQLDSRHFLPFVGSTFTVRVADTGTLPVVLQIVGGDITPTAADFARFDLAPMEGDVPAGDGKIDIDDAAIVMDLASGVW